VVFIILLIGSAIDAGSGLKYEKRHGLQV